MLCNVKGFFLFFVTFYLHESVALSPTTDEYAEIVRVTQEEVKKYEAYARQTVDMAENAQISMPEVKTPTNVIDQLLSSYKKIKEEKNNSRKAREGMYIFVSFSMPDSLLITLDKQAERIGAKLIIRGLKDNSFKETFRYIKAINQEGIKVDIDPEAFERFEIKLVPAFVVTDGNKYDKIVGNVSVPYVLEKFSSHGDTASLSQTFLNRLTNDN